MDMIYTVMNRLLFVMWMAGMLFLSSCSIKEDRDGCPCWMTVEMPDLVGQDGRSPVGAGDDGTVVLRLRGNSDEDAINYEYQVTEAVRVDVGALEYEVPRGSVGVSAVALGRDFSTPLRSARNDKLKSGYEGDQIRIPVGEQMDSLYGFFKMYHTKHSRTLYDTS